MEQEQHEIDEFTEQLLAIVNSAETPVEQHSMLSAIKRVLAYATVHTFDAYLALVAEPEQVRLDSIQGISALLGAELDSQIWHAFAGLANLFTKLEAELPECKARRLVDLIPLVEEAYSDHVERHADDYRKRVLSGQDPDADINEFVRARRGASDVAYFWMVILAGAAQDQAQAAWSSFRQDIEANVDQLLSTRDFVVEVDWDFIKDPPPHFLLTTEIRDAQATCKAESARATLSVAGDERLRASQRYIGSIYERRLE